MPWLAYADALLHREAMLWRVGGGVAPREAAGWFVTDADVEAILAGLPGLDGADPARAAELDERLAGDLAERRRDFLAFLHEDGRFAGLAARAGLDELGATVLALLAAVERSPQRQRLVAYLHDDMRLPGSASDCSSGWPASRRWLRTPRWSGSAWPAWRPRGRGRTGWSR